MRRVAYECPGCGDVYEVPNYTITMACGERLDLDEPLCPTCREHRDEPLYEWYCPMCKEVMLLPKSEEPHCECDTAEFESPKKLLGIVKQ